jgi:fumarate hydratase class II
MMPVMGFVTLESARLLASGVSAFCGLCLEGLEANAQACRSSVEKSLSLVTGLNPYIGYERAAALAKEAFKTGKTIRQLCREQHVLPEEQLDEALDPWRMTRPE